jgi:hypothetical protein
LDNEINRDAQTALNQTRQMMVAELNENVAALYQDAILTVGSTCCTAAALDT